MTAVLDSTLLGGYVLVLVAIGAYFARRQGDSAGFYLASRTLSTVRVLGTTFSTFLGTGLLFVLAAFGYRFGVGAFLLPAAAVIGFTLFTVASPRIKESSDEANAVTLPAAMAADWGERTRALAAVITAVLFTGTLAANVLVVGELLNVFLAIPPTVGVTGFAALVTGYTVTGGFRGVVWTDILQLLLIVLAFVVILPVVSLPATGSISPERLPASHLDPFALPGPVLGAYLLIGLFAFFGSQDLFQRIFAARDARTARRGLLAFTGALAVMGTVAVGLGIAARALLPSVAPDRALLVLADTVTPPALAGVVLLGFLGLANSDADSQLLTVASTVTEDVLPLLGFEPGSAREVAVDRVTVLGVGSAVGLVAVSVPSLTALFGMLGSWFAILGFVVVASMYWERTTDTAAFWALAVGFVAPIGFVIVTGNFQAATVIGLLSAAGVLGAVSISPHKIGHLGSQKGRS